MVKDVLPAEEVLRVVLAATLNSVMRDQLRID